MSFSSQLLGLRARARYGGHIHLLDYVQVRPSDNSVLSVVVYVSNHQRKYRMACEYQKHAPCPDGIG